jgi:uncharacterized protein involved in exopolysaccharide biosynthesis
MASEGSRIIRSLFLRMVLAGAVAGAAAVLFTMRLPDSYRARALLIMAPLPFSNEERPVTQVDFYAEDPTPRPNWLRVGFLESLPMPDYNLILTSEVLAAKVRDRMEEIYRARGQDVQLTVEKVRRSMNVTVKIFKQTYQDVEYQRVVELTLSGLDPSVVAESANYWAEQSILMANEMRFAAQQGALEYFERHMGETEALLEAERRAIEAVQRDHNPDALARRLSAYERELTRLGLELARLEAEFALPEQRAPLEGQIGALRASTSELRAELAQAERNLADHTLKEKYYAAQLEELAMSQYAVRLQSGEITPEFKVVSPALIPEEKTGPWRSLIVLVAAFLAVLAVPVHFFSMYALRRYARQIEQAS